MKLNKGNNSFYLKDLFSVDLQNVSSFKLGISVNGHGGIWWSSGKTITSNFQTKLYGNCNFFSTDTFGWTSPTTINQNGYFAFNNSQLIIESPLSFTATIFLYYTK